MMGPAAEPRVGIISTSGTAAYDFPRRRERAIGALVQRCGLRGASFAPRSHVRRGTDGFQDPRVVAEQLHGLYEDPTVDWIISAIGGFNTNAVLPHLDWTLMSRHPKLICGYSDSTALLAASYQMTGTPSLHGPALMPQWGDRNGLFERTWASFAGALEGRPVANRFAGFWCDPRCDWSTDESFHDAARLSDGWKVLREGVARGTLVGGNVETINSLMGTPYQPNFRGALVFLEATGDEAYLPRFYRSLVHLKACGVFHSPGAVIIGRRNQAFDAMGATLRDVLKVVFRDAEFPVVYDVDLGHTEPIITLPIGGAAEVVAEGGSVEISIGGWT